MILNTGLDKGNSCSYGEDEVDDEMLADEELHFDRESGSSDYFGGGRPGSAFTPSHQLALPKKENNIKEIV